VRNAAVVWPRLLGATTLALLVLGALAPEVAAQDGSLCPRGESPHDVAGFAELRARLGVAMGDARTGEVAEAYGGKCG
jgi:hypothetical protein